MTNGNQTVSAFGFPQPLGPFRGLNSHYRHRWEGAFVGMAATVQIDGQSRIRLGLRYHPRLDYLGQADWNLRSDYSHPKSYEHTASGGSGWDLETGYSYDVTSRTSVELGLDWRRWRVQDGLDRTFNSDGTSDGTHFNEAVWNTFSVRAALRFRLPDVEEAAETTGPSLAP
jgi:hypothetical protein